MNPVSDYILKIRID
ncbi:UNVERIFIED_CONTAM: hypothetical protein GTU68_015452 [Idotea baltica]|nr:hypothetical protein [Idotea baltica]